MRPDLVIGLKAEVFLDHYWLKQELVKFCRLAKLATGGSKIEIAERIATFLETGEIVKPVRRKPKNAKMPDEFTSETIIGEGWRSSQSLRRFFESQLGSSFHFNKTMRDFISQKSGASLQEAVDAWRADLANGEARPIEGQFEYNRFTRAYYENHPDAERHEVVAAWYEYRNTPKSKR